MIWENAAEGTGAVIPDSVRTDASVSQLRYPVL